MMEGGDGRDTLYGRVILAGLPCLYFPLNKESFPLIADCSGFGNHAQLVDKEYQPVTTATFLDETKKAIYFGGKIFIRCATSLRAIAFPRSSPMEVVHSISITALVKLPSTLAACGTKPRRSSSPRRLVVPQSASASGTCTEEGLQNTLFTTHAREQGCSYENGNLYFWHYYTGRQKVLVRVPVATLLGQWVHVAWILFGGVLYAYVNGIEHQSNQFAQIQPGKCGGEFVIGGEWDAASEQCQAIPTYTESIQHFAVFPRRISREEIRLQMQAAGIADSYAAFSDIHSNSPQTQ
jgi:hypothetical protein